MTSRPGTYALILASAQPFGLTVGRLGYLKGAAGYYIYCGSAFGPGGVQARTAHHKRLSQKPHWHMDYFRSVATIQEIWYSHDPIKREHDWTRALLADSRITIPFPGFGSSDCACRSHLVYTAQKPSYHLFTRTVHRLYTDHKTISREIRGHNT